MHIILAISIPASLENSSVRAHPPLQLSSPHLHPRICALALMDGRGGRKAGAAESWVGWADILGGGGVCWEATEESRAEGLCVAVAAARCRCTFSGLPSPGWGAHEAGWGAQGAGQGAPGEPPPRAAQEQRSAAASSQLGSLPWRPISARLAGREAARGFYCSAGGGQELPGQSPGASA